MARRRDWILTLIGVSKLLKTVVLAAVGIGALSLSPALQQRLLHLQAGSHIVRHAIARICAISPHSAKLMGLACLAYAALFAVEGVGLLIGAAWAEYVTTFITTSFLPIEIYELVHRASWLKALALVANVAIVIYLVWRLRRDHRWPFRRRGVLASLRHA